PRLRGKTLPARGTRRFGAAAVSWGAATGLCAGVTPPAVSFILLSRPTIYLNGYKVHVISLRSFLLMSCSSAWLVKTIRVVQAVFGRFEERGDSELPGKEMRLEVAGESVSSFSAWLDDA
ncbi:hypothetical protein H8959_001510, partial [Pygathrix nigripes]